MPKVKTDKGAAARFKLTGTGKLRRRKPNKSHLLEKKSSVRTRRLSRMQELSSGDKRTVKKQLGI